jgi:CRISPR/Cas system type I-B associated protein Csh2 (Cas7 group RAMP superfamily)
MFEITVADSNPWRQKVTLVDTHRDAEYTKCHLWSSAKNEQSSGQPFKSHVFCRVHWALNSGAKGLISYMFCIRPKLCCMMSYFQED